MSDDKLRKYILSELAQLLRAERLRQRISLNELSARAGLNRQTVSFVESEERTPTIDTLLRLTTELGIDLEDLIAKARKAALRKQ